MKGRTGIQWAVCLLTDSKPPEAVHQADRLRLLSEVVEAWGFLDAEKDVFYVMVLQAGGYRAALVVSHEVWL